MSSDLAGFPAPYDAAAPAPALTSEPRIRCKWTRRGSLLRGCLESPGSLGDVHSGRIANALVADRFEAKDEAKGTNEIVGQALVRAGNQLASERLTVGPAAGWGPRIDRGVPPPMDPSIAPLPVGHRRCRVGVTPSDACGLGRASIAASPASPRVKRLRFSRHRVAALPHHCRLQGPPLPPMPSPRKPHRRGRTPAQRRRHLPGRGKGSRA